MKTIILCGGQGTRIRDVSSDIPKPMLPIGTRPILWHIMKSYATAGHTKFVLCLGHKGDAIKEFFLNYEAFTNDVTLTLGVDKKIVFHGASIETGWTITLADTGLDTMTGGRVSRVRNYIDGDDDFLLTYGDGVSDVNINELIEFHRSHGKIITVTGVRPPGRFGEIESGRDNLVTAFNEKPQTSGGRISGGFFVCRREIFDYLSDNENLVFEQEPMSQLVRDGEMAIFKHDGFWQCMDTFRDFKFLNSLWDDGAAPWSAE